MQKLKSEIYSAKQLDDMPEGSIIVIRTNPYASPWMRVKENGLWVMAFWANNDQIIIGTITNFWDSDYMIAECSNIFSTSETISNYTLTRDDFYRKYCAEDQEF
jgi:hypothetical protein